MEKTAVLKRPETPRILWTLVLFGVLFTIAVAVPHGHCAGTFQQSFVLQPGWNAVFLEVSPENRSVETAFAGIPVASVWTWAPSDDTIQFIQNPNEGMDLTSGWLGYFPRPRPEAFLTNLFILQANRAYLIKLDGTQPVTWNVSGIPSLRSMRWIPDSFNLMGFHIDPGRPPTFGSYFADRTALEGQPIYRLDHGGVWALVEQPYSNTITPGEAYWVYCDGPTDFDGPMEVSVEWGDSLEFASSLNSQILVVRNRTVVDVDITLRQLSSQTPAPLSMKVEDEDTGRETWASLPTTYAVPAPAGRELLLKFGVRRAEFTTDEVGGILEVTNGLGARRLVPVDAKRFHAPPATPAKGAKAAVANFAGLWQGLILINGVSEAQMGGTTPEETGKAFPLRVLIHVDSTGTARLLSEVIEMWKEGTMVPDPENPGFLITETPGRPILLTNEDLIPNFTGVAMRDGIPVGIRLSSVAYDFPGEFLEMNGEVGTTGTLDATLAMEADFPTNPFKHIYHPDHNNLDEQFLNPTQEAYEVTRHIQFIFSDIDPNEDNDPEWGDSLLGGTYFEEISGLHRNTIYVGGTFRLHRVAGVPELNQ